MASTHLCPICKKKFDVKQAQDRGHFPFCSQRCKLIDLGHWLDGQYTIPMEDDPDAETRDSQG